MKHPEILVKDMIGKNNNSTGSQYTFDYSDKKYNPVTAPKEYFKIMYDKKSKNNYEIYCTKCNRKIGTAKKPIKTKCPACSLEGMPINIDISKNKRRGQNINAIGYYPTRKNKGQNINELRGWN